MNTIEITDTGLVYRNPMPHLKSLHAYFPSAVELSNGRLAVAMDIGQAFESTNMRSFICFSDDLGKTWTAPTKIFEPDTSSDISTTCRISKAPEGNIAGLACIFDRSRSECGLGNPQTEGFVKTEMVMLQSSDDGKTWSNPKSFSNSLDWQHYETCSTFLCIDKDRWLAPCAIWPDWQGKNPFDNCSIAFISDDGGKTFPRWTKVIDDWENNTASWEQKVTALSDGRLLGVCWAYDYVHKKNLKNRYTLSNNRGDSFSQFRETPLQGETCSILGLEDNKVVCVYRRMDKPGLWCHLAKIENDTWIPITDTPLWGTHVLAHDTQSDSMLEQMSSLRFGFPNLIRLANGDIFVVFWCVEDCVSNIRWFRLKING